MKANFKPINTKVEEFHDTSEITEFAIGMYTRLVDLTWNIEHNILSLYCQCVYVDLLIQGRLQILNITICKWWFQNHNYGDRGGGAVLLQESHVYKWLQWLDKQSDLTVVAVGSCWDLEDGRRGKNEYFIITDLFMRAHEESDTGEKRDTKVCVSAVLCVPFTSQQTSQ